MTRIGHPDAALIAADAFRSQTHHYAISASDPRRAFHKLIEGMGAWTDKDQLKAMGYLVVHGVSRFDASGITPDLVQELRRTHTRQHSGHR